MPYHRPQKLYDKDYLVIRMDENDQRIFIASTSIGYRSNNLQWSALACITTLEILRYQNRSSFHFAIFYLKMCLNFKNFKVLQLLFQKISHKQYDKLICSIDRHQTTVQLRMYDLYKKINNMCTKLRENILND